MSEILLSLSGLSVVADTTDNLRSQNQRAILPWSKTYGTEVNEAKKIALQPIGEAMFGAGYLHCVGSLVVGDVSTLMTHYNAEDLQYLGKISTEIQRVDSEIRTMSGRVAVVWVKNFSDVTIVDMNYKDTAVSLKQKLVETLFRHVTSVYEIVFEGSFWPVSAYYNADSLKFVANLEDYEKLLSPKVSKVK